MRCTRLPETSSQGSEDVADFSHLPEPSTLNHLSTLLSSHQSDEDIQSELVEILGFEGDGLSLVEEILRPGVRKRLVAQLAEPSRVRISDAVLA